MEGAYTSEQHGKRFDIYFADNENTEQFWDINYFPLLVEDYDDIRAYLRDYIENGEWFGEYNEDEKFAVLTSGGEYINVETLDPKVAHKKLLNKLVKPQFVIWDTPFDTQFYVRDFEALKKLQEYTGWFDMDIYYDWI